MSCNTAAVIDVGSNSLKLLVARLSVDSLIETVHHGLVENRISGGIGLSHPYLSQAGMMAGITGIHTLLEQAAPHKPDTIVITGTSAVRDAGNKEQFLDLVQKATGHSMRVLSGVEEAHYIGCGICEDPMIKTDGIRAFYLADLGGGSLELIEFDAESSRQKLPSAESPSRNGQDPAQPKGSTVKGLVDRKQIDLSVNRITEEMETQAHSLPLGGVRLTEKFIPHPAMPVSEAALMRVAEHVRKTIENSPFSLVEKGIPLIGTGGAASYSRMVLAELAGAPIEHYPHAMTVEEMRKAAAMLCAATLQERCASTGMPESRAEIMPAAMTALLTIAEMAGVDTYLHSHYNLRYGLAAELLGLLS